MAYHPLYPVARRYLGRPVNAHHKNGQVYSGILQNVTDRGIYLLPVSHTSYETRSTNFCTLGEAKDNRDLTQVYSPAGFFAFGALSGLTLGALASRPPYYGYGGYGYGYPGYGGYYGYGYGAPYVW
ncbi:hypothetical protein [Alicyclobacillus dauci]|uniref:Uncharacterized protein n=1 Tax=Alicyclobacillus dauci TaxID=1475485 RepID=A0ABY6Z691_9BACL|nr:hypothetical protein [Alicyclobacillus dauci]WAH37821.1 hypothetical protein NZD86_04765 [Alicyclobacillus dauci]